MKLSQCKLGEIVQESDNLTKVERIGHIMLQKV